MLHSHPLMLLDHQRIGILTTDCTVIKDNEGHFYFVIFERGAADQVSSGRRYDYQVGPPTAHSYSVS